MEVVLYDWGPSPFCLKVRAILDHKRIAYRRLSALGRPILELRRRGGIGKVPALELDGELVCDSTDIAYALERRVPEPAVLPADARERALCHALEDWADESLYFVGLYFQWIDPAGLAMVPQAFGRGPLGKLAFEVSLRRIRRQVRGQGTSRKPDAHVRADLERHLDALEALVAPGPFLLGEAPLLCDFAVMSQLVYLARTPHGGPRVAARPALTAYLERMKALRAQGRTETATDTPGIATATAP
jgi:glutathione S-transferase